MRINSTICQIYIHICGLTCHWERVHVGWKHPATFYNRQHCNRGFGCFGPCCDFPLMNEGSWIDFFVASIPQAPPGAIIVRPFQGHTFAKILASAIIWLFRTKPPTGIGTAVGVFYYIRRTGAYPAYLTGRLKRGSICWILSSKERMVLN